MKTIEKDVLVVIDLQPGFAPSTDFEPAWRRSAERLRAWNRVVKAAARLVASSARRGWAIVVLEFHGYGPTVDVIGRVCAPSKVPMLFDNGLATRATKFTNGGAVEVQEALQRLQVSPRKLRVSGINTPWCVLETVQGLATAFPKAEIEIAKNAVGDVSSTCGDQYMTDSALCEAQKYRNVRVVEA